MFTSAEAIERGLTRSSLRWGEKKGRWKRLVHGVYGEGPLPPTAIELAVARAIRAGVAVSGPAAGVLHRYDGVPEDAYRIRTRGNVVGTRVEMIDGIACTDALQTFTDLAATLDDLQWEQALESALRTGKVSIAEVESAVPALAAARAAGTARIRRVLALRPPGAPPTGPPRDPRAPTGSHRSGSRRARAAAAHRESPWRLRRLR